MAGRLSGKTAVICGASEGIGAAIAQSFADAGATLLLVSRRADKLKELATRLPGKHSFFACDLSKDDQVQLLANKIEHLTSLEILVNNAGGPLPNPPLSTSIDEVKDALQIHLYAPMRIIQSAVPVMRKSGYGRIINVVSVTARIPLVHLTASNIARSAVLAWTKTLSESLAPEGITANNVLPGYTATSRLKQLVEDGSKKSNKPLEVVEKGILQGIPFGRFGRPEEIAGVALFLASPDASYVTGASIQADGGFIKSI